MKLSNVVITLGILLGSCCNKDFIIPQEEPVIDNDFFEGALDVTSIMNTCSAQGAYTTVGATADRNNGECWPNSPISNRWFKVKGPATGIIYFYIHYTDVEGTMTSGVLTLWDTDGQTELDCDAGYMGGTMAYVSTSDLTPGQYYYFSVDVEEAGDEGTFRICWSDSD